MPCPTLHQHRTYVQVNGKVTTSVDTPFYSEEATQLLLPTSNTSTAKIRTSSRAMLKYGSPEHWAAGGGFFFPHCPTSTEGINSTMEAHYLLLLLGG
jgi:hypothetical protein